MAGERILIVDDDVFNLKLLAYVMRIKGYEVTVAPDAESALESFHQHRPEIILVDIQLSDMDGLEMVRQLRTEPHCWSILIVAVTAYAMRGDRERAIAAGCDDYVTKPIDTRTLPDTIARALESRRALS